MKKAILPLLLLILLQAAAFGQAEESALRESFPLLHHKFFFRAAFSTARGDYESTEGTDESGFADDGRILEFGYEYRVKETIGIVIRYSNMRHGIQETAFSSEVDRIANASVPGANFNTVVQFNQYRFNSILASPRLYNELGKNTFFVVTPTIGFSSMIVGELKTTSQSSNGTIVIVQDETSAEEAFMYGVGGGLNFRTSNEISINLFVEYLEAEYRDILVKGRAELVGSGVIPVPSSKYNQRVQVLNFGVEIGYNF